MIVASFKKLINPVPTYCDNKNLTFFMVQIIITSTHKSLLNKADMGLHRHHTGQINTKYEKLKQLVLYPAMYKLVLLCAEKPKHFVFLMSSAYNLPRDRLTA